MTPDDVRMLEAGGIAPVTETRLRRVDCDVHHALRNLDDLKPYLSRQWWEHLQQFGLRMPAPFSGSSPYPKAAPALSRADAWPPDGSPPGADLAFMQKQLLDAFDIELGLLHLLYPCGMDQRNQDFGAALCRAINCWVADSWTDREPRLKAAISVPGEDAAASVAEIEHWAGHPGFVQVALATHSIEPLGRRRYWPIYEAAVAAGLPIGLHTSGYNGYAITPAGWPSFYVEEQHGTAISQQAVAISLVVEGVFARFPELRVVVVEAGFAWVPSVAWRLDQNWRRLREEVPHLTRAPSEYMRENMWFTTQPLDEPERTRDLRDVLDWIGWDRVLFASDYPHWDMDSPDLAIKLRLSPEEKRMIYGGNARAAYRLP